MLKPILFWPRDTGKLLEGDDGKPMKEPTIDPAIEDHAILKDAEVVGLDNDVKAPSGDSGT